MYMLEIPLTKPRSNLMECQVLSAMAFPIHELQFAALPMTTRSIGSASKINGAKSAPLQGMQGTMNVEHLPSSACTPKQTIYI